MKGLVIEARRNHSMCLVGENQVLVTGGINSKARYLSDTWLLQMDEIRWRRLEVLNYKSYEPNPDPSIPDSDHDPYEPEPGLAFHTMTPIFSSRRKNILLFKPLEKFAH